MKKNRNKISKKASMAVMGLATLGIIGVGGLGVSAVSNNTDRQDGLASRLAAKFGLNQSEVSSEIEAYRSEKHTEREAETKVKLSEALQKKVDDGTITAEQKTAIEVKLEESRKARQAEREANNDSESKPTREEMRSKMEAEKAEMDAWLKEQGINLDLKDVLPSRGGGRHDKNEGDNND